MNTTETKVCTKCGAEKDAKEFSNNPRNNSGKSSWCRACEAEHSNKSYHKTMSELNFYREMSPVIFF